MFNVNGPTPITPLQRTSDDNLFLRVNQRVAGDVLNVSNGQVVISIQGVPIVARLSSPDQMAMLLDKQTAQFLVKELTNQTVILQLLPDAGQPSSAAASSVHNGQALAADLLNGMGVEVNSQNLMLVEAALNKGLTIDNKLLAEMRQALAGTTNWGPGEAQLAASLAASGLPVTEATIQLAKNAPYSVNGDLSQLMNQLQNLADQNGLSAQTKELANRVLASLQNAVLGESTSPETLRDNLQKVVTLLGRSVENELMGFLKEETGSSLSASEKGLLALNHLQGELQKTGNTDLAQTISHFLDGIRWMQLTNSPSDPAQNQWTQMEIPLQIANPFAKPPNAAQPELENANIRIARQNENDDQPLDPQNTRLVIQMDLADRQSIQVDLTVVHNRIGANISTSTEELCEIAREELTSLSEGLEKIGYDLNQDQVNIRQTAHRIDLPETPGEITLGAVDLET
jgi:hypothetical protein